ncbi:GGDEF domain-containing protein [Thalassotalea sp. 1_MG-2023]|uniref:GGDEF domain-containing protein n=1 Tax=Thalassotalea sp. 1_MG-2023 TaxID=3062680 RepID=UPI0026E20C55|nr:GGDEF domain-containing protein [Thalassotalea sp. 1_MG-2023]MDO6425638.1 GGDEF domain-containing protein [Thalassotalea sp. 1_MG-2023]
MSTHVEIALAVILISLVMFFASLLFHDKAGDKPARIAFRTFYFSAILFFISISNFVSEPAPFNDLLTDIFFAISNASLTLGILWRCKSRLPEEVVYGLTTLYLCMDVFINTYSVQFAYSYNVICSLICAYALLNRQDGVNTGDKGMAAILFVHAVLLIINLVSVTGVVEAGLYNKFMMVVFVFAPAYMAGLTIFLFASYMLDARKALEIQATTDPLTGLYNRRFFFEQAKLALSTSERHGEPLCLMMCDIDHFKDINDSFGHKAGDNAIKAFSNVLQASLRIEDVLARYGGEEFVILLPQTSLSKAQHVAERMRSETENIALTSEKGCINITASFGVCQVREFNDIETSINHADKAMYAAKSAGRNNVKTYSALLA